jgi:tRNA/tmRNA/rRNA uracil-C5-methylase (TrmA/RlmC/RlmD family)
MPRPPRKFRPEPFDYHQELELTITALSNLGVGIARVPLPEKETEEPKAQSEEPESPKSQGWVVFVPFCLPGERVRARIYRNDKSHSSADLLEILTPSPDRVEPRCSLFGKCGGCQYQHLGYEKQLEWKREQVAGLLHHMAGIDHPVEPTIPSPREWNYRSKITPHFQKPQNGKIETIGFLAQGTRSRSIELDQCTIAMESINQALPIEKTRARESAAKYKKGATLLLRAATSGVHTNPHDVVEEQVGPLTFRFLAGDFFQNNPYILPAFTDHVAEQAGVDCNYLVDAYCGSGLFGLSLAHRFEEVAGIEVSETSADWARQNARENKLENVVIHAASAEHIFAEIKFPADKTAVVIDPPRKGCGPEFLDQLFAFSPKRVVYVSCNPATQIRDLESFLAHGYQIKKVQPFDLFPQTRHLECVVTLEKI